MSRNIENHDSVLLLQDCIAGCKMALESMDDIRAHTDDKQVQILRNRVCLQRWLRSCRQQ